MPPSTLAAGLYTLNVLDPETGRSRELRGRKSEAMNSKVIQVALNTKATDGRVFERDEKRWLQCLNKPGSSQ
jgi:hypothetical protein